MAIKQRVKMLTAQQETDLLTAYLDEGDIEARNDLIKAYMPMVKKASYEFARRGTAPQQDLEQEAIIGLSEAIDNFKRDKNTRLSTLAVFYMKARLMRYVMDQASGDFRVGTNAPDKKVFMNLRRMVANIQAGNGGNPITDKDRQVIADELGVKFEVVARMEPRVFSRDIAIAHTDMTAEDREDGDVNPNTGIIAVEGDQGKVDQGRDQTAMMARIRDIVENSYCERDLEIVMERIQGDMTREKYEKLVRKHGITIERIRQIQRGALQTIRRGLHADGIRGIDDVAI